MDPQERQNMEDFKTEVREDLRELTKNVSKLTEAVSTMTTALAVTEEQKKHQEKINIDHKNDMKELKASFLKDMNGMRTSLDGDISTIKESLHVIVIERAEEKQSRAFLMKWWVFLLFFVTIISISLSAFISNAAKTLLSGS